MHSLDPTTSVVEEQSRETNITMYMIERVITMYMVERVPTDGCSSFSGISIDVFPPLYVGDIEISLEEVSTRPNLHEHENLVATEEKDY